MRFNVWLIFSPRKMGERLGNKKKTFLPVFAVLIACSSGGNQGKASERIFLAKMKTG